MDDLTTIQPVRRTPLALRSETSGELYTLSGEMVVGREVECDIQLASLQISRYHAKLSVSANGVYVEDLQSSNGTYVNGRRIQRRTALSVGDQLAFDDLQFRVTTARSGDADTTRVATLSELKGASLAQINAIAADRLTPAREDPEVLARGREALLRREKARVVEDAPVKARDEKLPRDAAGGRAAPTREPKVHEIPDMEAFLRFAGSGLRPQAPLSKKEANPFGLNRRPDTALPESRAPAPVRPAEPERPPLPPLPETDFPLEDEDPLPPAPMASPSAPVQRPAVRREEEDDKTRYVSLSAMDRFVETNARYQNNLDAGSGPRLIAMTAPIRGKVFPLGCEEDVRCWSIGRDDSADVCLRDKAVSREHAWITKLEAVYQLRVNDEASEILVNGRTCVEAELKHGDRLQFGAMALVFRLDVKAEVLADETPPPPPGVMARVLRFLGLG